MVNFFECEILLFIFFDKCNVIKYLKINDFDV